MTDLNSLINPDGIFFNSATGINNTGQVIITGAIPEPATYACWPTWHWWAAWRGARRLRVDGRAQRR